MTATWGLWYWPSFLVVVSVLFLPAEIFALVTNAANTLSDYSWREMGLPLSGHAPVHSAGWFLSLGSWLVIASWLTAHIWFVRFR